MVSTVSNVLAILTCDAPGVCFVRGMCGQLGTRRMISKIVYSCNAQYQGSYPIPLTGDEPSDVCPFAYNSLLARCSPGRLYNVDMPELVIFVVPCLSFGNVRSQFITVIFGIPTQNICDMRNVLWSFLIISPMPATCLAHFIVYDMPCFWNYEYTFKLDVKGIQRGCQGCIHPTQNRVRWQTFVNNALVLWVQWNAGNLLTSWVTHKWRPISSVEAETQKCIPTHIGLEKRLNTVVIMLPELNKDPSLFSTQIYLIKVEKSIKKCNFFVTNTLMYSSEIRLHLIARAGHQKISASFKLSRGNFVSLYSSIYSFIRSFCIYGVFHDFQQPRM